VAGVLREADLEAGDLGAETGFEALEAFFAAAVSRGRIDDEKGFHGFSPRDL
jgi:hypothetical protein